MSNLPNIKYKKIKKNPTIDSDNALYELPFYKDAEYFSNLENFVSFVKSVENLVRTSTYYSRYIKYLKEDLGLNYCQVLSNIKNVDGEESVEIEMHHGPILTLFDYVCIMVDYMLAHDKKITSYRVADKILDEHFENHIQVVMLSKTVHQEVHDGNIFINTRQAFGDLNAFLEKYHDGLSDDLIRKINTYINTSENYDSFDKGVLELKENIKNWSRED